MNSQADRNTDTTIRLMRLENHYANLTKKIDTQIQLTEELLSVWQSAKHIIIFVQILAKLAVACGVIWAVVKGIPHLWSGK